MECKIDSEGFLQVCRSGFFKDQNCLNEPIETSCGDWCPGFYEEPETILGKYVVTCTGNRFQVMDDLRRYDANHSG